MKTVKMKTDNSKKEWSIVSQVGQDRYKNLRDHAKALKFDPFRDTADSAVTLPARLEVLQKAENSEGFGCHQ